jgi:transposase
MRTGRPKSTLKLTEDEKRELTSLAHRSRSAAALARRARIVLACAEGHDNQAVARKLPVTPATVGKWRKRFVQERLEGLYDEPRPGAPRTISDEQVAQLVVRTLESTPRGATHWSTGEMAKATGHSHMTHPPHLASFRLAAASQRELQAFSGSAAGAESARYRGLVHEPAGARGGAVRGGKVADSGAGSHRPTAVAEAGTSRAALTVTSVMARLRCLPRSTPRAAR